MRDLVGILLAAGSSRRFGSNKLLHPLHEETAIAVAAAKNLLQAMPDSIAVVRTGEQELTEALIQIGIQVVENPHADEGMSTSIVTGIKASEEADGWIIALADMPWVKSDTIKELADKLHGGASIVAPGYKARRGNPVGFSSAWKDHLLALRGDRGAKALLDEFSERLQLTPTDDEGVVRDIDVLSDLGNS